ncbi:dihydrofolate reductase family protein [Leifsonia sp. A12D58]|uniref:dihydrofolate reductase family protein n=1 Tax=Leifsonia sp. A12D58 TaxID=3397674 RepID=UPI0039DFB689
MKADFAASVFIGTSLDGFIARENGDIEWLTKWDAVLGDTGFDAFFASIDTLVVGRNTYETVREFEPWPYEGKRVLVFSRTMAGRHTADELEPLTSIHDSLDEVVTTLNDDGARRVYVDGGQTIQTFLRAGLITDMIISRAPVLLGSGIPLFGPLDHDIELSLTGMRQLNGGFSQTTYKVVNDVVKGSAS